MLSKFLLSIIRNFYEFITSKNAFPIMNSNYTIIVKEKIVQFTSGEGYEFFIDRISFEILFFQALKGVPYFSSCVKNNGVWNFEFKNDLMEIKITNKEQEEIFTKFNVSKNVVVRIEKYLNGKLEVQND